MIDGSLKPCPFCGCEKIDTYNINHGHKMAKRDSRYCGVTHRYGLWNQAAERIENDRRTLKEDAASWRRVAERLEEEKQDLRAQLATLTLTP